MRHVRKSRQIIQTVEVSTQVLVPAAKNKKGVVIREAFYKTVKKQKQIPHDRFDMQRATVHGIKKAAWKKEQKEKEDAIKAAEAEVIEKVKKKRAVKPKIAGEKVIKAKAVAAPAKRTRKKI